MAKQNDISKRQKNILDCVWASVNEHGWPPTIREIGRAANIPSTSVVSYNLKRLEEKGYLTRESEVSRGIQLTDKAMSLFGAIKQAASELTNFIRVPLAGDIVASNPVVLGHDDFAAYDAEEDVVEISAAMLPGRKSQGLYALRVRGNSMIDAMVQDDDIVIMESANEAKNGEMVAVWLPENGEMTLKYFFNEGSRVRLQPANPTMEPIYVHPGNVRVQGKVMMVVRQTA